MDIRVELSAMVSNELSGLNLGDKTLTSKSLYVGKTQLPELPNKLNETQEIKETKKDGYDDNII
ncbi:MAG: hypothetical protein K0R72_938 [Clostridia bacterium]|jgi:hypothetical protein|nr:hypothetical protein [Clostridia bacterium]